MKNFFDQLAKAILTTVLHDVARLESNREIRGHVLVADIWVESVEEHESALRVLGILGQMVACGTCLIEPFSSAPGVNEVRSCILKQYSLDHAQRREARTKGISAPPFPRLWIISAGRPDSVIDAMDLQPMVEWPLPSRGQGPSHEASVDPVPDASSGGRGVIHDPILLGDAIFCGRGFDRFHLVVVRQLPRTPETLILRLLSRGTTFREAVDELAELPEVAPELTQLAERVMHVLVAFANELPQDPTEEDMQSLQDIEAAYSKWERRVKAEGKAEGRAEGKRESLRMLCECFGIELTDERLEQVANSDAQQLDVLLKEISTSHKWPEA